MQLPATMRDEPPFALPKGGHMREFLAIVFTLSLGLFMTTILAYSLEYRQLAYRRIDTNANVRPGIVSVSRSGYAVKVLENPVPSELRASNWPNEI